MVKVQILSRARRGGLGLLAGLMVTTAAWADEAATVPEEGQGIAVGEPSPQDDALPDVVIDDGLVIGGWEDDPAGGGDGVDDGSDGGDDGWVDDGQDSGDDDWVDDGTDGGDDDWVDDGQDGGDDGWVDDGLDGGGVIGIILGEDGVIRYLDDQPSLCVTCDAEGGVITDEILQMSSGGAPRGAGGTAARPATAQSSFGTTGLAQCLALYPELPWICEWQYGANQ